MRAVIFGFALLLSVSCRSRSEEVVVYTSVDDIYAKQIFDAFTKETGIRVLPVFDTEEAKTLGLVHRILAERDHPQGDVFWSGDCARSALLRKEGVLEPYRIPTADGIGPRWRDPNNAWTGFGARARVIVYNTKRVKDPPRSVQALADPAWKGRIAVANPLFGTTAAHVVALAQTRGEDAVLKLFAALRANDVRFVGGNSHVRDLVARGDRDAGLTDTDDVWIGKERGDPIEMIYPDQEAEGTLVIPNSAALLKGAPHAANARKFLDWLLRPETEVLLSKGPSHQIPLRNSDELGRLKAMNVDWGKLSDAEALLDKVKRSLGL
ncbi:MAG TPA: extracellular solute-binding protein [Planctomycetota bacterium]|jgi:iron(III) transport system substrate-binding protein|nr:extracellular solute-binding protein [Planctomycetota bacterium]